MSEIFKKNNKNKMITINMTENDRIKINEHAKIKGYKTTADYIRELIKNDMGNDNKEDNNVRN